MNEVIKFAGIALFVGCSLSACEENARYYRQDCIVRLNVDWSSTENQLLVSQQIMQSIVGAPKSGFNDVPPSSAIQGELRQYWYLQYTDDCENRIGNTRKLLEYVKEAVPALPNITIDDGVFQPGPDTIRASGEWWIDSDPSPFTDS